MSDDRSEHNGDVLRQVPSSDILNLHWVARSFEYISFFRKAPPNLPIVWTLHHMNPFTGGCHFDGGCGKFNQHCGACPQMGSSKLDDFSAHVWKRKNEAFARVGANMMHIVAPSRWLAAEAKKSSLFGHLPVSGDFRDWSPYLKKGGVVAFHDVNGQFEGPTRVVTEELRPALFGPVHNIEFLAWAVKTTASPSIFQEQKG